MEQPTIATLAGHSALQLLRGAKDEGFKTLLISTPERESFYKRFNIADEQFPIPNFKALLDEDVQNKLLEKNVIIIPHGSFVEYVGAKELLDYKVPIFGNKKVLDWESDRKKEQQWFKKANIRVPKEFKNPSEIDRLALVKYHGARGGKGYVLVKDEQEFNEKVGKFDPKTTMIQEYMLGTRFYPHFFYAPFDKENELTGIDIRYESNADGLPRMPTDVYMPPTYVVTGNWPVVIRESLLPELFDMADNLVKVSKQLFNPGLIGPYCIEMVCTDNLELIVFEMSARIVAGTNIWVPGSPYTYYKYGQQISAGRRIAMEIKRAINEEKLDTILS